MITQNIEITPQKASEMLERNTRNRKVNEKHVSFLARQMTGGDWIQNGDSIRFDLNGNLIDGQHRLWAIIKSKKTMNFIVVSGLASESFSTIDTGKTRNGHDVLSIEGIKYPTAIAALARLLISLRQKNYEMGDKRFSTAKVSNSEILNEYRSDPLISLAASFVCSKSYLSKLIPKSQMTLAYYLCVKFHGDSINLFFNEINENSCMRNSGSEAVREYFIKNKMFNTTAADYQNLGALFKGLDYWIAGTKVKRLNNPKNVDYTNKKLMVMDQAVSSFNGGCRLRRVS